VKRFGYLCPGWEREAHPASDLTADHLISVARGGSPSWSLAGALPILQQPAGSGGSDRIE